MEILTKKEYLFSNKEIDYIIDSENVADMKLQHCISEEKTLYGKNIDADQFMLSSFDDDIFFINTSFSEVLYFLEEKIYRLRNHDNIRKGSEAEFESYSLSEYNLLFRTSYSSVDEAVDADPEYLFDENQMMEFIKEEEEEEDFEDFM